jgi:hypothetical protein
MPPRSNLRALLQTAEAGRQVLPWQQVEQLVAAAAPAHVPWYAPLIAPAARPLRFAAVTLTLLVCCIGVLAAVPAQSDQVGTLVLSRLPSGWEVGSPAFTEAKLAAQQHFDQLGVPQGELYVMVGDRRGHGQLAFALLGAGRTQAKEFYEDLSAAYPALAAFQVDYQPIDSGRYGSMLNELLVKLSSTSQVAQHNDVELRAAVLRALKHSGLSDIDVTVKRNADGSVVIDVEATLEITVDGHSPEEMEAQGLSEDLLGPQLYQQLLKELELPSQK